MDVLIVGAGAMGRWFGAAVDASIAFADVDPGAAAAAADAVGGRTVPLDGDETFDAVCFAVPMGAVEAAIAASADRADHALLDVAGVMEHPLAAMAERAPGRERVSLHPLFAPARSPGTVAVVEADPGPTTDALLADLEAAGNDRLETTATDHDAAMETVQAATHAAVLAFSLAADPDSVPTGLETPIYAKLRGLARQTTGGTPRVYADVQRTFDGADAVADAAARIATAASDGDDATLEALYREAARTWHANEGGDGRDDDAGGGDAAPDRGDAG